MADPITPEPWKPTRLHRTPWRKFGARLKKIWESTRTLTAGSRALPHFIIIGAQKGGTSTLYAFLKQHPSIVAATRKEVHFFDLNYHEGVNWYRSHFPRKHQLVREGKVTGEASPYYLFHPHVPGRIRELLPEVRLIALLRNPVHRAISHYFHVMQRWGDSWPVERAFFEEEQRLAADTQRMKEDPDFTSLVHQRHSYKARGIYADQIENYLRHFDRNQLLVLSSEALFANPEEVYRRTLDFLGLDRHPAVPDASPRNVGKYKQEVPESVTKHLQEYYAPHNARLYQLIGEDFGWDKAKK